MWFRATSRANTDDLHVFMRVTALLTITVVALTVAHVLEIAVWASFMALVGITVPKGSGRSNSRSRTTWLWDTAMWSPVAAGA